jgi:hypothetical protein
LLAKPELLHLELQLLREIFSKRGVGDVAARLVERPHDKSALEAAHCRL